jgi:hypothetical protein
MQAHVRKELLSRNKSNLLQTHEYYNYIQLIQIGNFFRAASLLKAWDGFEKSDLKDN